MKFVININIISRREDITFVHMLHIVMWTNSYTKEPQQKQVFIFALPFKKKKIPLSDIQINLYILSRLSLRHTLP